MWGYLCCWRDLEEIGTDDAKTCGYGRWFETRAKAIESLRSETTDPSELAMINRLAADESLDGYKLQLEVMRMLSVGNMVLQLQGLVGTTAIRPKDDQFIRDMKDSTDDGKHTKHLTPKQVEYIESLWETHYGN